MNSTRESSSRLASMADALDGVNLSAYDRAEAKAQMRSAEAMIDAAEQIVRAVRNALIWISVKNTAWRRNSVTHGA